MQRHLLVSILVALATACSDSDGSSDDDGAGSSGGTTDAPTGSSPTTGPDPAGDAGEDTTSGPGSSGTDPDPDSTSDTGEGSSSDSGGVAVDPTFSFMVIPDTQNEVLSDMWAEQYFDNRIEWIVDNEETLDVRWVLQTGDLVNWDTPDHDQYVRASNGFAAFDDAAIPYAIAIGNHDTAATCNGGSACPGDVNANLRDTSTFNEYFPLTRFPTIAGVFETDKCDNSFHLFEAGGLDWIVISIELWARTEAFEWMGQVLADHPGHNAIVITHSHLEGNGEIFGSNGGYGDNSPQLIFDEVLSQHANVRFVFSGHAGVSGFREDAGANGNAIYQFLYNRLDGVNPVRIVEIDTEANTVDTEVYSPATDETMKTAGCTVNLTDVDWVR